MSHRHEFSAWPQHFGKYGPQDVHYHPCVGDRCSVVLLGGGRECDGDATGHERKSMTVNGLRNLPAKRQASIETKKVWRS